jgi:UDP-2,4-diacetamido-2,4,6-trideoxy-beta-L-altropyranose hydrolase
MVKSVTIAFRVDSAPEIGIGHVMRCLTLANVLSGAGHICRFIARAHAGHSCALVTAAGHELHLLPRREGAVLTAETGTWLGADLETDALETVAAIAGVNLDWLIVDHYAVDAGWHGIVRQQSKRLMVIDDLANRTLNCDLVLDQTFGRDKADYAPLVPQGGVILAGSSYALLRPEFVALRQVSLLRRKGGTVRQILVSMGGSDLANDTGWVLEALASVAAIQDVHVDVVLGAAAPNIGPVKDLLSRLPIRSSLSVGVTDMARRMAEADLAIGAAGSSAWERCCLGVPSVTLVTAGNQKLAAGKLVSAGATIVVEQDAGSLASSLSAVVTDRLRLSEMSDSASLICDGNGTERVLQEMGIELPL